MIPFHEPVMLAEVLEYLAPAPGKLYVDCTAGGGGHSEAILSASQPGGRLIGLDQDEEALEVARKRLAPFGEAAILVHDNFSNLRNVFARLDIAGADGFLFDLGVSSHQFEKAERGFSFRHDAPLDMRMNRAIPVTAADLVNTLTVGELTRILKDFGEERWARRIAEFIVRSRLGKRIETTGQLADIVRGAIPKGAWPPNIDPSTRTFQALRIAVNGELEALEKALGDAVRLLNQRGRIVVLSYNSLEDRIVKQLFLRDAGKCQCPPGLPVCACGAERLLKPLTKKPVVPSAEEVARNPRSRSAKLRAAEKL